VTQFRPDRKTYVQSHVTLAAIAMGAGMAILWALGNPHVWTGALGGLAAVALRGWYLMDEALAEGWTLADDHLEGPGGRRVALDQLDRVRSIGSAVQLVTKGGDKHLIKYQADPQATVARIESAR
jgi:hypothetical protein